MSTEFIQNKDHNNYHKIIENYEAFNDCIQKEFPELTV